MKLFSIEHKDKDTNARVGQMSLPHGVVSTPAFMPVGTQASVKGVFHKDLWDMGYRLILANTYHLILQPGLEVIEKAGGLHGLTGWSGNFLTDSGGFQVFSLQGLRHLSEKGVTFRSHLNGDQHQLTPESVMLAQSIFNSDIAMVLDVCTPYGSHYSQAKQAMEWTHQWAQRALEYKAAHLQQWKGWVFPIVQGNFYQDLRIKSAHYIDHLDTQGLAIGGLSVGESKSTFLEYLKLTAQAISPEKVRYVMGIGTPDYIFACVENGIDIFDCVHPTRLARNGCVFTKMGTVNLKNLKWKYDFSAIESDCLCFCCQNYTKAYLRHLFKAKEMLSGMLCSLHNLYFLNQMMENIRTSILDNRFKQFKQDFLNTYEGQSL